MVAISNTAPNAAAAKGDAGATGHWYTVEGSTVHPLYKEGGTFTLREARKHQKEGKPTLPSVTTYFKCMHKQQLVDWMIEQGILATLVAERSTFNRVSEWVAACLGIAKASSKPAMDLGVRIHKAIEVGLDGGDYEAEMDVYVRPVFVKLKEIGFKMVAQEKCVASPKYGYAGRCDLLGYMEVLDAKSRKTLPGKPARGYGTDLIQNLAYGVAEYGEDFISRGVCRNVVISTTEPGRVEVITHDPKDHARAWEAFIGLTAVWRFENNFDPRIV